jgi:hypothetical protein
LKDIFAAFLVLTMITESSAGLFNTCNCWGVGIFLKNRACIPLNWMTEYKKMNDTTYPGLVAFCVGMQMLLFFAMLRLEWHGIRLMR